MENVKIQQDGKWIHFSINSTKVIGQTEKGGDKIAQARWEQIPGTNLKVMLMVIVAKDKKEKVKDEDAEAAPPVNKTVKEEPEVVAETREERKERREKEKARAARKAAKGNTKQPDEDVAVKQSSKNSRRPTERPKKTSRAATTNYSDGDF